MTDAEWRVLLDENIEPRVGQLLQREGYEAEHVRDALTRGTPDEDVLAYAVRHDCVLVTADVTDLDLSRRRNTLGC